MQIRGYGLVNAKNNSKRWNPEFYDPILRARTNLGYFDTFEEANRVLGFAQFEYYKDKTYMLPKGIQIQNKVFESSKTFFRLVLSLPVTTSFKKDNNQLYLGAYTTIQDALKVKFELFNLNS